VAGFLAFFLNSASNTSTRSRAVGIVPEIAAIGSLSESRYFQTNDTIMPGDADPRTFQFIGGSGEGPDDYWAKDKNYVYDNGELVSEADPASFRGVYDSAGQLVCVSDKNHIWFFHDYPFTINPRDSVVATGGYCKTQTRVYLGANVVNQADPRTFVGLERGWNYGGYAKDKRAVFYMGFLVNGADVTSFAVVRPPEETSTGVEFDAQDKSHLYAQGNIAE
jgi:hypothetical protein